MKVTIGEMKNMEFVSCVEQLRTRLRKTVEEFLLEQGARADWETYRQHSSIDREQDLREILFFAGDIWPNTDEKLVEAA